MTTDTECVQKRLGLLIISRRMATEKRSSNNGRKCQKGYSQILPKAERIHRFAANLFRSKGFLILSAKGESFNAYCRKVNQY